MWIPDNDQLISYPAFFIQDSEKRYDKGEVNKSIVNKRGEKMNISNFMTKDVVTCKQDQTVAQAAKIMVENNFSVMPVTDNESNIVGILTESDFVGKEVEIPHALASIKQLFGQLFYFGDIEPIYKNAKNKKLSEVMTKNPICLPPEANLTDVINLMISKKLKRIPVIQDNKVQGIVTRKDLLKAYVELNSKSIK